eukprot:MONOS_1639.1-p1 / transcript=MONOS_1639.1 / gene=MONOS_1639 / organism=Monocercomonoides_exilis_PA203 / gene_product=unspecified product / transcript_product=unspecified product / location=Mono_scaffold00030:58628-60361(+) / protein_length=577 / sequence_SO=supercontig / SO=protein_coding / is_pseudo=false
MKDLQGAEVYPQSIYPIITQFRLRDGSSTIRPVSETISSTSSSALSVESMSTEASLPSSNPGGQFPSLPRTKKGGSSSSKKAKQNSSVIVIEPSSVGVGQKSRVLPVSGEQEDAEEFLAFCLSGLDDDLRIDERRILEEEMKITDQGKPKLETEEKEPKKKQSESKSETNKSTTSTSTQSSTTLENTEKIDSSCAPLPKTSKSVKQSNKEGKQKQEIQQQTQKTKQKQQKEANKKDKSNQSKADTEEDDGWREAGKAKKSGGKKTKLNVKSVNAAGKEAFSAGIGIASGRKEGVVSVNEQGISVISILFGGELLSRVCRPGEKDSLTVQRFFELSADIADREVATVEDAIERMWITERIRVDRPSSSASSSTSPSSAPPRFITRSMSLFSFPPILVLHLKRFIVNWTTGQPVKIAKHIEFGEHLRMFLGEVSDWFDGGFSSEAEKVKGLCMHVRRERERREQLVSGRTDKGKGKGESKSTEVKSCYSDNARSADYDLCGVVVHHGATVHSGHYISYVHRHIAPPFSRTQPPSSSDSASSAPSSSSIWLEFNDNHVNVVSEKKVFSQQAYILIYTRRS